MKMFDLTWGESVCVRDAFIESLTNNVVMLGPKELSNMKYPAHNGDEQLIALTKNVIKRQMGIEYKHILLTNGATGGVTISLRAFAKRGYETCYTREPPYFAVYPTMIESAGIKNHKTKYDKNEKAVILLDSPSNPQGMVGSIGSDPVIWDAVYNNLVYCNFTTKVEHMVSVGSYSKLTGLNGIRIGWIATNDDELYKQLVSLVTAEYCGLSKPGSDLLLQLLKRFNWNNFEKKSRTKLDLNREEWQKLTRYFGGIDVKPTGMFYYAHMDSSCKKLMKKSNILWMPGSSLGTNDNFGRFNLGQSNKVIKDAVKEVLKNDRIK